jgi:hypothetical protein
MDIRKITDLLKLTTPYQEPQVEKKLGEVDSETSENLKKKQEPVEELLSWDNTVAPYKVSKRILRSMLVFLVLFVIFLVLVRDWMFLLLVLSFAFVFNILLNSPAKKLNYKIYTNGIDYDGQFLSWDELNYYFFYEGVSNLLVITSKDTLPGRIYVYFDLENKDKVDNLLNNYLDKKLVHPKDFFEYIIFKIKPYINLTDEK